LTGIDLPSLFSSLRYVDDVLPDPITF
jgi:hypothetical protein